ncbi:hypothetical protein ACQPYK_23840 [Streptosporangium sp. CA-135522]|uniref:hypothetical protein n=1 Tax=Streptosporangium sp. CA-135522 TaxID=3240072 RepID=UPI003D8BA34F
MGAGAKRGLAAAGTVLVAAAVNVATGMLTQEWAAAWWAAVAALVVVGGGLAWWLTVAERPAPPSRVSASGPGSVAASGSVRDARTKVRLLWSTPRERGEPAPADGVTASGAGAIAAGGDIDGARTEVTGEEPTAP